MACIGDIRARISVEYIRWARAKLRTMKPQDANLRNCDYEIKEQDRFLPIANVARVMKQALPPHAKLSKEAKVCTQECVSEFISFISSQAMDRCTLEKRKTLNGEDILWAMFTLGFEHYAETLKIYLAKYRQYEQEEAARRTSSRRRRRQGDSELSMSYDLSPGDGYTDFDLDFESELTEQEL